MSDAGSDYDDYEEYDVEYESEEESEEESGEESEDDLDRIDKKMLDNQLPTTKRVIVDKEKRILTDVMTLANFTELIGVRATQIEYNPEIKIYCEYNNESSALEIAEKELRSGKFPLCLERERSPGVYEIWYVNEMILPE